MTAVLLAGLPAALTLGRLVAHFRGGSLGLDFVFGPWTGANWVLDGRSAYVTPDNPLVTHGVGAFPDYPAPGVLVGLPFSWLPQHVAGLVASVLAIAAVLAALRVLGVRDWRVYGAVLLWRPVMMGWEWGNVVLWCVLGTALCWRWRDHPIRVGAALAAIISIKLFGWPLAFWLLATRRYRAFAATILWTLAFNLAAWAIVGFGQIAVYIHMMRWATASLERHGTGLVALVFQITGSISSAEALLVLAVAALVVGGFREGIRGSDISAFTLAVAATLFASPIMWLFSYSLLVVPLALIRPRLSLLWLLPIALDIGTHTSAPGPPAILLCLAVTTALIVPTLPSRVGQLRPAESQGSRPGG